MSDDPQKNTTERAHRVRERAYRLWEADGRPEGREQEYWERRRPWRKARSRADARGNQPSACRRPQFRAASSSSGARSTRRHPKPRGAPGSRSPRSALTVLPVGVPKTLTSW